MRHRLATAVLAVASTLGALALCEVGLRLATGPLFPSDERFSFRWMAYDPVFSWRNVPGSWKKKYYAAGEVVPVHLRINAHGLRGPEIALPKPAGVTRIACLGDSATFGLINNPKPPGRKPRMVPIASYPAELSQLLAREAPERFEVLNAGVIGYSSSHGLRQLAVRILDLDPDIITVRFGVNDSLPSWAPWYRATEPASRSLRALLYASADWKLTRLTLSGYHSVRWLHPEPESVRWTSVDRFRRNLERIVEIAGAGGAGVLLLDYPIAPSVGDRSDAMRASLARYHAVIRDVSRRAGVPVLETRARFARHAEPLFDPIDIIHPNPRGAAFLAQLIDQRLRGLGWLDAPGTFR